MDEEVSILRSWKRMTHGYDQTAKLVNATYQRTSDIRQTMRETRMSFDVVWEMVGFKDKVDCMEMEDFFAIICI